MLIPGYPTGWGQTYNWQVVAKNSCLLTEGPVQQFTLRELPDLVVANVDHAVQGSSGENISVSWTIQNMGFGNTQMATWFDRVYLSEDQNLDYDIDIYLGGISNFSALNPGQSYTESLDINLPVGAFGSYYIIVETDLQTVRAGIGRWQQHGLWKSTDNDCPHATSGFAGHLRGESIVLFLRVRRKP